MARRRLVILLCALLALVVGLGAWRAGTRSEATLLPALGGAEELARQSVARLDVTSRSGRETLREGAAEPARSVQAKALIVYGRAIDEQDRPLDGFAVRLGASGFWAQNLEVPALPGEPDFHGFEVLTDSAGRFSFEVPWPTNTTTMLVIESDPFHESLRLTFGRNYFGTRPEITFAGSDLGTFKIRATGVVEGSVGDTSGHGLEGAQMTLTQHGPTPVTLHATSDGLGNFSFAGVVPGSYSLAVSCPGHVLDLRDPLEVLGGKFSERVDFVLRDLPTVSGFVVDEQGNPLEGVALQGTPIVRLGLDASELASATSRADGSFHLLLPVVSDFMLTGSRKGLDPYEAVDPVAPDTRGLKIVMKLAETWPMLVVDAQTDRPIERYGLHVARDGSEHVLGARMGWAGSEPPMEQHPGGSVDVAMRPGLDVIDVFAPGYETQRVDLEPGPPADGRIVVRLTRR